MAYRILVLVFASGICLAQTREPDDAWLMRNYHFAGPPAPETLQPVSPVVAQLNEIQNTTLSIMRKADFDWDFETALAAAAQATATAQLIGAVTGELKPPSAMPPNPPQPPKPGPAHYVLAFRDGTIQATTAVWTDHLMLHYTTLAGAHVQIRPDRVDWKLTAQLNRKAGEDASLQRPGVSEGR
jgi:hypothetical protein